MRENPNDPASKDQPQPDIPTLVQRCMKAEEDRNLSDNSMKELRQHNVNLRVSVPLKS